MKRIEPRTETDREVLEAVEGFVYDRHDGLSPSNVMGFDEEELERIKIENDHLVFTVEDVDIKEKEVNPDDNIPTYFVSATLYFQVDDGGEPIEGSTDIYMCYRCGNEWCIEWHSS